MTDESVPRTGWDGAGRGGRRLGRRFVLGLGLGRGTTSPMADSEAGAGGLLARRLEAEGDRVILWVPVLFGLGIAVYFALPREPSLLATGLLAMAAGAVWWHRARRSRPVWIAAALFVTALGTFDATLRTRLVAGPVIPPGEWFATVEGLVEAVERRPDGSSRIRVAPFSVETREDLAAPRRLSLWVRMADVHLRPGDQVRFNAVLLPPPDAAVPGGFDYARQAWFDGIGGVGFLVARPEPLTARRDPGVGARLGAAVERLRATMSDRIAVALPGPPGAIAVALVTGERGGIPETDQEALRASGLAHILAISGLHMMLVVGTLFWAVRAALALSPGLALNRPIKKWAAAIALAGGTGYLLISGAAIATQRAYVMAAVMLLAILLDRPALTMRNVAVAAMIVLVATPEAMTGASFQMSFSATVALIAVYELARQRIREPEEQGDYRLGFFGKAILGLLITSLIAGIATAPFGAFHFNRIAAYGLVGNLAAMPLVSLVVMPAALVAACLMPFGLEAAPLAVMGLGIEGVLLVAHRVESWAGAVRMVPQMPVLALGLMTAGGLWLALWRTRWRLWGLPVVAAGLVAAWLEQVPDLYVNRSGSMIGLRLADGDLALLPRAGSDYEVETWLRHAGLDIRHDDGAATAGGCDALGCFARGADITVALVRHPAAFAEDCGRADVVVATVAPPAWCAGTALVIGPDSIAAGGAMTIRRTASGLVVETAGEIAGNRPWSARTVSPGGLSPGVLSPGGLSTAE